MASTYTPAGIELITDGEQSGTWGQTTNTNWELIEELATGVVSIALTGTTYTLTTTDGTSTEGRHAIIKFTGSPGGTCTVTVSPNDMQKIYWIVNTSDQTVTISQGTGSNVSVLAGSKKVMYCDGAGAGAAVVDLSQDLDIAFNDGDKLTFGDSEDFEISHDGTDNILNSDNGDIKFQFTDTSSVEMTSTGVKTDQIDELTSAAGVTIDGVVLKDGGATVTADVNFGDDDKANFGTGGTDLQIYHDGSHNRIDTNTGNLYIRNFSDDQDIYLQSDDGTGGLTTYVHLDGSEGSVGLRHYGTTKLATTSTGIDVTGTVTADGLTVDGNVTLSGSASPSLTITDTTNTCSTILKSFNTTAVVGTTSNHNFLVYANNLPIANFASGGDISFYEPTGTNASLHYDASTQLVVNEDSRDFDFRVESDNNANMIFVDGGNDHVTIGSANDLGATLNVQGDFCMRSNPGYLKIYETSSGNVDYNDIFGGIKFSSQNNYYGTEADKTVASIEFAHLRSGTGHTAHDAGLIFKTSDAGISYELAKRLQINNNGDLYIWNSAGTNTSIVYDADSSFIVNDDSRDFDFRVESDTNTHALFVQGSDGYVGVNYDSPVSPLHINRSSNGNITAATLSNYDTTAGTNQTTRLDFGLARNSGALKPYAGRIQVGKQADWTSDDNNIDAYMSLQLYNNNNLTEILRLASQGNVGIAQGTISERLNIKCSEASSEQGIRLYNYNETQAWSLHPAWKDNDNTSFCIHDRTANVRKMIFKAGTNGETVINEESQDTDFRVESNSNSNMLYVDGGTDQVGIGTNSLASGRSLTVSGGAYVTGGFSAPLTSANVSRASFIGTPSNVSGGTSMVQVPASGNDNVGGNVQTGISLGEGYAGMYAWDNGGGALTGLGIFAGAIASVRENISVTYSDVVINEFNNDVDFRVESDSNTHALFVDGGNGKVIIGSNGSGTWYQTDGIRFTGYNHHTYGYMEIVRTTTTDGSASVYMARNNNGRWFSFHNGGGTDVGNIYCDTASGTTYNTTSDRRLKDNIETITDGTDKLMAMNPVTHTWKSDPDAPAVHGFIAQEMQDVVPEAVSGEDGGDEMMSMDYGRITPVIVAALQDAHRKINELESRLAAMEK